jgi:hypothetical protein
VASGGLLIVTLAFFSGRVVETRILAARARVREQQAPLPAASTTPPSFHKLQAVDILALPFAEFYEALRSAPTEARTKWAADIEAMPVGPRRTAALAAFYKLVVQFDPLWAANNACEITNKETQDLALESVTGAAPGFALKDIATLFLKLPADPSDYRKYLEEVISDWIPIDPPAVAQFYDEHPEIAERGLNRDLIKSWAAIDPRSAKKWLDAHPYAGDEIVEFVMGWYLNDGRAATDYAVEHAEELAPTAGLGNLLMALYSDSKEEAKNFIEHLPNDQLRNTAFRAFEFAVQYGTADETGEPDRTPRAIADWMTQFPSGYWRGHLSQVLSYWNAGPPEEVLSWIEQQPAEIQDAVAAEYTLNSAADAVKTVTAVSQFGRTDLRDRLLAAMFHNSSPSAGQMIEAITNSSLPAEQKKHVLEIAAKVEKDEAEAREERARAESDQGSEK